MSDLGLDLDPPKQHRRRQRKRNGLGCLAVLVAVAVLAGGGYFVFDRGVGALRDRLSPPEDYSGPGQGKVLVEVSEGDVAADIGNVLVRKDVVASVEAFTDAAAQNPESRGIQVGFYEMKRQMSAQDAVDVLVDPQNLIQDAVVLPEGLTVDAIVQQLAKQTDFPAKAFQRVLDRPGRLGLPAYAKGNPEGYLFPATYQVPPNASAKSILQQMVDRFEQAAADANLEQRAKALGYTPAEVVIVASLVESEASRAVDRAKVARVIYNRLEGDETNGLLQLDATVNYAAGRNLGARTSASDRQIDSPYNTYRNPGLPPTPIEAPGDAALEAAANPAEGPWNYYVTVDLRTGETKFAEDYQGHLRNKAELDEYCRSSEAC